MTAPLVPYGRQDVGEDDIDAVVSVLRSDWLTQGPAVPRFEAAVAAACQARFAVAVNSATSALHVACLALVGSVGAPAAGSEQESAGKEDEQAAHHGSLRGRTPFGFPCTVSASGARSSAG